MASVDWLLSTAMISADMSSLKRSKAVVAIKARRMDGLSERNFDQLRCDRMCATKRSNSSGAGQEKTGGVRSVRADGHMSGGAARQELGFGERVSV